MKKKLLLLSVMAVLITFLSVNYLQAQETTSQIQGLVTDGKTGIDGATVTGRS